ncbi:toll-like receptor 7 [Diaphorina citri]|uniref:Toll-like receptor 7 n=1 Tax=Diaphorina citri TaxID=121845 RepID=A0A3Q0ISR8_DIACI|nr:toll-like receptor 7 [Diaphorina citri]
MILSFLTLGILCHLMPVITMFEVPENCSWKMENESMNRISVTCNLNYLGKGGGSNLSFVPTDLITKLNIDCDATVLLDSSITTKSFQNIYSLEELKISNCKLVELPVDVFSGLRNLKRLTINTRNLQWDKSKKLDLVPGSLDGLRELQVLNISSSNIKSISDDVFCSLANIQTLNLSRNSIRDIDTLGFAVRRASAESNSGEKIECSGGMDLRILDLSHNKLRTLGDYSGITKFRRLQNLHLENNEISQIAPNAFVALSSLRILNISSNHLVSLPEGLFSSCRDISEIYAQKNSLVELSRGLFHKLEQLLVLDLSSNHLSSNHIDETTFIGLIRLIILNLSNNELTRIDAKTFKDLVFLQRLDLRNNSIGYIEDNAFLSLYNLHTIYLSENRIHHITAHLFNGLYVLSKLTLSNNLLVNIDSKAFKNCSALKELDLSSNAIVEIPSALSELPFLKTLDLGENQISKIENGSFKNLQQLTDLRLVDNNIGNLSSGMLYELPSLEVLNLSKNKIHQIEIGTFEKNKRLAAIRLDSNFLTDINGVFTYLAQLLWLNLSENHLVWFDYAMVPGNLKWLDIHGNYISSLNNYYEIKDGLSIKNLDASHNRILEISELSIPNSVEVLFINNNLIKSVKPHTFFDKSNLARVDIYANDITKLDLTALRLKPVPQNKTLPEFYLGGNPFDCDCSMDWLPIINNNTSPSMERQYPKIMDLDNVVCKMTYSRGSTHLPASEAAPSQYLCPYDIHCFALCHCCEFDACDCEMTCPKNCSCFHDQNWNTNVVDCSEQQISTVPPRIPMDATHVYLDGNTFKTIPNHVFIGRKNMLSLYVNNSQIEVILNQTFNGLSSLQVLHLENNLITHFYGYEFDNLEKLSELYLQENRIEYIANGTFNALISLQVLQLDGNRLKSFRAFDLNTNSMLRKVYLGNNPFSCSCATLQELQTWIIDNSNKVKDGLDISCVIDESSPPIRKEIDLNSTTCTEYYATSSVIASIMVSDYLPFMIITFLMFLVFLILIIFMFVFKDPFRVWLYTKYGIRLFNFKATSSKHFGEDREKLYDGYVVYSPKDEEFVLQSIVAELEHGNPSYQLCLHYRDLPSYLQQHTTSPVVIEAAEASRRVILVLTKNFLQTEWSRSDFRSAIHEALTTKTHKLVLVEENIVPEAESDIELKPYLKSCMKIRWGEKRFWERLRYAMPTCDNSKKSCNYRRNINNYTIDSGTGRRSIEAHHTHPYSSQHISSHPLFKASTVISKNHNQEDLAYSSATTATPSPKPHRLHCYTNASDKPVSDHIYSSIDTPEYQEYASRTDRNSTRRMNGKVPVHQQTWSPAGVTMMDSNGVQAYLV